MTLAAYGVAGKSDSQRARRGLPGKAFFAAPSLANGLPGEECHARHVPFEGDGALVSFITTVTSESDSDSVSVPAAVLERPGTFQVPGPQFRSCVEITQELGTWHQRGIGF
jgi:hypothetical protein